MSDEISVCPECDKPQVTPKMGRPGETVDREDRWRCKACGARFAEPNYRERQSPDARPVETLAGQLERMDPTEFP